jgi:hypothetical protein
MNRCLAARIVRYLLAPLLSLWIAGAGCMLGCEGMMASAASLATSSTPAVDHTLSNVVSGDACSSSHTKSHDCCKKRATQTKPVVSEPAVNSAGPEMRSSSSETMNGCPLAVSRAAVIGKVRGGDPAHANAVSQSIIPHLVSSERPSPDFPIARLPNRGHTYLRCCVFLI